jgi:hypothetical protein
MKTRKIYAQLEWENGTTITFYEIPNSNVLEVELDATDEDLERITKADNAYKNHESLDEKTTDFMLDNRMFETEGFTKEDVDKIMKFLKL